MCIVFVQISCQGNQKTDLVFSDLANKNGDSSSPGLDDLAVPLGNFNTDQREADISLILVDGHFLRHKFVDLFDLPVTEYPLTGTNAGMTHLVTNSIYDKINPAIMWFGYMGSGCDIYASTNVWPYRAISNPETPRDNWQESCYYYHRYSLNAQVSTTVSASVSTSPRWAINSRICHQVVETRIDSFLEKKMNFNLLNLPSLSEDGLSRLMEVFMPSYKVSDNEVEALLQFENSFTQPLTNAQKRVVWKNAVEAVCQSPFWHAP